VSGYAEAAHRLIAGTGTRRGAQSSSTAFDKVSCEDNLGANHTRFLAFLDDMRAVRRMGYDTYHIWPQVLKIDVLHGRDFGYIGRVETLARDWDSLLLRLGAKNASTGRTSNPASHNVDSCGMQIVVPASTLSSELPTLCELLSSDFVCFGYPLPEACQSGGDDQQHGPVVIQALHGRRLEPSLLADGATFFSDRSYQMTQVPTQLIGGTFFRFEHNMLGPLQLNASIEPSGSNSDAAILVFWNKRPGLHSLSPMLAQRGFSPVGNGPAYNGSQANISRTEMWAFRLRDHSSVSSVVLDIPAHSRFGVAVVTDLNAPVGPTTDRDYKRAWTSRVTNASQRASPSTSSSGQRGTCTDPAGWRTDRYHPIQSFQKLSEELQSYVSDPAEHERLFSQKSVSVHLAECGSLAVPFGGLLLKRLEGHLRECGSPFSSSLNAVKTRARAQNPNAPHGKNHMVTPLHQQDLDDLSGFLPPGPVMFRSGQSTTPVVRAAPISRISTCVVLCDSCDA